MAEALLWLAVLSPLQLVLLGHSANQVIGNLSLLPQCKEVFPGLEKLYDIRFHVPKHSQYCTAIGAALDYTINGKK